MNTDSERVRRQHRTTDSATTVAVTGAAGGVGRVLVQRLLETASSGGGVRPIAIDTHRADIGDVTWRVADIRDPRLAQRLVGVDTVIHTDDDRSLETPPRERHTYNLRGAETVLTAAAARQVRHVVLVTSTMVYGAAPDNPVPLPESAPVHMVSGASQVANFTEIEDLARRARRAHPGLTVTVVRPAPLVGPDVDNLFTRHFAAPRLLSVKGCAQSWQFCHIDDLADALTYLVGEDGRTCAGVGGAFAVGGEGALPHAAAAEIAGLRGLELPASVTFGATQRLHRLGIVPAPAEELRFLVYPCVVDCATLRAAGWHPRYTNTDALRVLLDARGGKHALVGRTVGRKEVTITAASAAGAAVAALGTAAAVRHLRRRRHGG